MSDLLDAVRPRHPTPVQRLLEDEHRRALDEIGDALIRMQDRLVCARWRPRIPDPHLRLIVAACPWFTRAPVTWYEHAAFLALGLGHYHLIPTRDGRDLYLLRLWLTEPRLLDEANRIDGNPYDSSNSHLLHYFARGDDDESLHDHPWTFGARVLAGGYDEHLPPTDWIQDLSANGRSIPGPDWRARIVRRSAGDLRRVVLATDLHCVGKVDPGTWTLIDTGPKVRTWGFHPPGRPWIRWDHYLAERRKAVA